MSIIHRRWGLIFFFSDTATAEIYTLSLHDALPISRGATWKSRTRSGRSSRERGCSSWARSEEHTSELQSHHDLVCRLLLEKKKPAKHPSCSTLSHTKNQ